MYVGQIAVTINRQHL